MLELDQLKAFLAVADAQSFSAAAEKIHLTQPAVSKRIHALESHLNQTLFNRLGRGVQLTEAGQQLVPKAQALIAQAVDIERHMQSFDRQIKGSLAIGMSHHVGLHRLPKVLKHFTQHYPEVTLEISFLNSEQAPEAIISGRSEIVIATLPTQCRTDNPSIHTQAVWSDPLMFVTHPNHPLQTLKMPNLKQISKYPGILPHRNTITRKIVDEAFQKKGLSYSTDIETNYLETNRMLISVGLGWGIIPEKMTDNSVRTLDVKGVKIYRTLGYFQHAKRSLSNAAKAMISVLDAFKEV